MFNGDLSEFRTSRGLAVFLYHLGIRGVRMNAEKCPLAWYYSREENRHVMVTAVNLEIPRGRACGHGVKEYEIRRLSDVERGFVSEMDDGLYPFLEIKAS